MCQPDGKRTLTGNMVYCEFDDNSTNGEYDLNDLETNNVSVMKDGRNDAACWQSGYQNGELFEQGSGNKVDMCQLDGRRRQTFSNLLQLDGAASSSSSYASDSSPATSEYESDQEVDNTPEPVVLVPAAVQPAAGQPLVLEVDTTGRLHIPSSIPLCMVTNFRSIYNKIDNFRRFLKEVAPDCTIACETWDYEGRRMTLEDMLEGSDYKVLAYRRKKGRRGGSCAIIYNEVRFKVEELHVDTEDQIESVWAMFTPRQYDHKLQKIKRICVSSVYIAPRSALKQETMDHIIQTIHCIRSKYNNEVHFIIGGDVNKTNYEDVLDSYGALKQCVTVNTRKGATLTMILSDLHSYYHPPTTLAPLQVDEDKAGKDSDHDVIIFAPKSDANFKVERKKKVIKCRPLPDSKIPAFGKDFQEQDWQEIYDKSNLDEKVLIFHKRIVSSCVKHFPEKLLKVSNLDKKWMTPYLKNLSRKIKKRVFQKCKIYENEERI